MLIAAISGIAVFLSLQLVLFALSKFRERGRAARPPPTAPGDWRPNSEKVRRIERQLAAAARAKTQRKTARE